MYDVTAFRNRLHTRQREGGTISEVSIALGWTTKRGFPDNRRLRRTLGLLPWRGRYRRFVHKKTYLALDAALRSPIHV